MDRNRIIVTHRDAHRLRALLDQARGGAPRLKESLASLEAELNRAEVVPDDRVPQGVIVMNSEVELENLEDGDVSVYTLVYPEEADAAEGRISVLAPIGTGMLGYREGDVFEWQTPGGLTRLRVRKVTKAASRLPF